MSISGDFVSVTIGASPVTLIGLQKWHKDGDVVELNGQTAQDGGYAHPSAGTKSLTVTMQLCIDITSGDLVIIEEGTTLTDLALYADISSGTPVYLLPEALVLKAGYGGEMGGKSVYDVTAKNVGPYDSNDPN